jgi:RepB DNA-primase from phage plasmid
MINTEVRKDTQVINLYKIFNIEVPKEISAVEPWWWVPDRERANGPIRAEAERFLAILDPKATAFTFQTFDDNKERKKAANGKRDKYARVLNGTLDEHWDQLCELNAQGAGIYITVNETDLKGRETKNIKRVRALFTDLDGAPLEPVMKSETPPHIAVVSSPGKYHAYQLVTDVALDQFTGMQEALAARFGSDPKVSDLPRVLRLPGFFHCKGERTMVRIVSTSDAKPYKAADFHVAPKNFSRQAPERFDDWFKSATQRLNDAALANLSAWVPELFPKARPYHGGYRVSSKDLGRELEEDLSLVPEGIKDFGVWDMGDEREGKRTPIDVVMEWTDADFGAACDWLRERLKLPEETEAAEPAKPLLWF